MEKSCIFGGSTLPAKGQAKSGAMMRYDRRQLLKEKAAKRLIPKNTIGAEIEEVDAYEGGEEESGEEVVKEGEADGKKLSTGSDAEAEDEDVDNTSALQALADNFTVRAADQGSDIEEISEGSTMGHNTSDRDLSGLVEMSDNDEETKESESFATPEVDMYYIETIKSSRVGKDGKLEFFIKWQGYEKKSDLTWEPETTLVESAPEILSEYLKKIGGRETIGAKRKRGRPSKTTKTDGSEKLPKAKKRKVESESIFENVKMAWNEGEGPSANSAKKDKNGAGKGDNEETIPKAVVLKKGRGRLRKSEALETPLEGNSTSKTVHGIVPAEAESSLWAKPSKSKKKEPMSKAEQEEKMKNLRKPKEQFARQDASPDSDDAPAGPIVSSSSNDVAKKGRPSKRKARENSLGSNDTFKNTPGIVPAQAECPGPSQASNPKNNEAMGKIEGEEETEKLKGLKKQSDLQGLTPVNEPAELPVTHANSDVAEKGLGRPPKAPSADQVLPGKDNVKEGPGRPPRNKSQASSQAKPNSPAEASYKKGSGCPPKSKEPEKARADEGLAGGVAKRGPGRPQRNSGSTPSPGANTTLKDTPAKRGRGCPSKIKEPVQKQTEEEDDDRESSTFG